MCVRNAGKGDVSYMFTDSFIGSAARRGEQDYGKGNTHTHTHMRGDTLELAIVPDAIVR